MMTTIELYDEDEGARAVTPETVEKTTHLDFNQAMEDFRVMFPEMDPEVIENVLRSNKGAVDTTIDQLLVLAMEEEKQQEAEKESVVTSPSDSKYLFHAHFISKRTHRKLQPEVCWQQSLGIQYCNAEGKPILLGRLPCDFLRLDDEGAFGKNFKGNDSDFAGLGALLQSPEFVEALKKDREFMQSLAEETQRKSVPKGFNETIDDEATTEMLKERIAKMGKVSRKKLTKVARGFLRGKKLSLKNRSSSSNVYKKGSAFKGQQSIMCDFDEYENMSQF